jgi:predicted dehydrogenase
MRHDPRTQPSPEAKHHGGLRLGAVGAGYIFETYEKAAARMDGIEFAAVMDPDADRRRRAECSGRLATADLAALLECELDAILILSPNHWHGRQAIAALEAGFDVLCEKPLATTLSEARQAVHCAETHRQHLRVAMHCRHRPEIEYVYRHLDAPVVRFAVSYLENWTSAAPWFFDRSQSGGGVLLDVGVNQLDWLLPFVEGLVPTHADAVVTHGGVEKECATRWSWPQGEGTIDLSWQASPEKKVSVLETAAGTRFELDHQAHTVRRNGELVDRAECREYEKVLADFRAQLGTAPTPDTRALRVLELLRETYQLAGLPFLNG